jgi:hypothetical protein
MLSDIAISQMFSQMFPHPGETFLSSAYKQLLPKQRNFCSKQTYKGRAIKRSFKVIEMLGEVQESFVL